MQNCINRRAKAGRNGHPDDGHRTRSRTRGACVPKVAGQTVLTRCAQVCQPPGPAPAAQHIRIDAFDPHSLPTAYIFMDPKSRHFDPYATRSNRIGYECIHPSMGAERDDPE